VWVEAAMRLEEKDLKMMHRLVRAQSRRTTNDDHRAEARVSIDAAVSAAA
jgi:hypothetical protein